MNKGIKIIGGIFGVILLLLIIIGMSGAGTKEVQVGVYEVDYDSGAITDGLKVPLPEGTSSVRVIYELEPGAGYGFGGNGNIGVASGELQDGVDPFMNGNVIDSKYIEGADGNVLNGELTFSGGDFVVYSGMFDGKITVYATVPA